MTVENKPLLFLGSPFRQTRSRLPNDRRKLNTPTPERQEQRLKGKLNILERAFLADSTGPTTEPLVDAPERAIVFEIANSSTVDDFHKAIRNITGVEWLSEFASDEDDDEINEEFFYTAIDSNEEQERIKRRLYLVMADQQGLSAILDLWKQYQLGSEGNFPRGQAKWRHLFSMLLDVRLWSEDDRVLGTGLRQEWEERVNEGSEIVRVEIELWYRGSNNKRIASQNEVRALVEQAQGQFIKATVIDAISYHAVLAALPINAVQSILDKSVDVKLIKADSIMFVRPAAQALIRNPITVDTLACPVVEAEIIDDRIHIALLDGLPIENHVSLKDWIEVDDPEGWASTTPAANRKHGTAMASLIVHSDLSEQTSALRTKIYLRLESSPFRQDTFSCDRRCASWNFKQRQTAKRFTLPSLKAEFYRSLKRQA